MYEVGEKIVIKESMKLGKVQEVGDGGGMVHIECEDGTRTWVMVSEVAKFLLDEAPKGNFLQD